MRGADLICILEPAEQSCQQHTSFSFTGPLAEANLRRLFADAAFISARGLSLQRGLTEANPFESS
jgi:DeoR/GlpR family transcriptional regulator of sugar metabolism